MPHHGYIAESLLALLCAVLLRILPCDPPPEGKPHNGAAPQTSTRLVLMVGESNFRKIREKMKKSYQQKNVRESATTRQGFLVPKPTNNGRLASTHDQVTNGTAQQLDFLCTSRVGCSSCIYTQFLILKSSQRLVCLNVFSKATGQEAGPMNQKSITPARHAVKFTKLVFRRPRQGVSFDERKRTTSCSSTLFASPVPSVALQQPRERLGLPGRGWSLQWCVWPA